MSLRYLLDTTVLSEPTRPRPDSGVMAALEVNRAAVATASLVVHELRYGVERLPAGRRRRDLESYVVALESSSLPVLAYDGAAARWHAGQRAALERAGTAVPFVDGMIAAVAAVNGLAVVTRNTADFAPFDVDVLSWWTA